MGRLGSLCMGPRVEGADSWELDVPLGRGTLQVMVEWVTGRMGVPEAGKKAHEVRACVHLGPHGAGCTAHTHDCPVNRPNEAA